MKVSFRSPATSAIRGFAIVCGLARAASADDVPQRARELAERGRELHDAGNYAAAAARFQEAYALSPSPGLLFNLAQDYRLSGDCEDAAIMYRRFLASDPSPDARAVAEVHLDKVSRCIPVAAVAISAPAPPPAPVDRVPPDTIHTNKPRAPRFEKDLGLGLAIGGGLALAGAGYFAWRAHDDAEAVSRGYAMGVPWSSLAGKDAEGHRSQRDAMIFGIGGGIAAVSGVALYVMGVRAERTTGVSITPAPGGARVAVSWGF